MRALDPEVNDIVWQAIGRSLPIRPRPIRSGVTGTASRPVTASR